MEQERIPNRVTQQDNFWEAGIREDRGHFFEKRQKNCKIVFGAIEWRPVSQNRDVWRRMLKEARA